MSEVLDDELYDRHLSSLVGVWLYYTLLLAVLHELEVDSPNVAHLIGTVIEDECALGRLAMEADGCTSGLNKCSLTH